MIPRLLLLAVLVLVFVAGACSRREHMRADFGQKTREHFTRQAAKAAPEEPRPSWAKGPEGLDSEEAALIHQSYRRNMTGRQGQAPRERASQVLRVEEPDRRAPRRD